MKNKIIITLLATTTLLAACGTSPVLKNDTDQTKSTQEKSQSGYIDQAAGQVTTSNNQEEKTETTKSASTNTSNNMQTQPPQKGDTIATIETTKGAIKIKLFTDLAPETVKNFTELAKDGKYNNVPFHRIINDFMIQTGDFDKKNGTGGYSYKGPGTKINDEVTSKLVHLNGTVSMANAGPNTNGSQFFIVSSKKDNSYLNGHYSVFGQVFEGQDVVDDLASVETDLNDRPLQEMLMKKVTISTY